MTFAVDRALKPKPIIYLSIDVCTHLQALGASIRLFVAVYKIINYYNFIISIARYLKPQF